MPDETEGFEDEPVIDMGYLSLPADVQAGIEEGLHERVDPSAVPAAEMLDLLEFGWGVIANAGWHGDGKTEGWQEAAERWRDQYHGVLDRVLKPGRATAVLATRITPERPCDPQHGPDEGCRNCAVPLADLVRPGPQPDAELERLRSGAQSLGRTVVHMSRSMRAAQIEMHQNGPEKAMQWILNSLPDVDDNPEDQQWDGNESATEWLDRTAEVSGE